MAEEGVDAISPTSITSEKEPEDAPVPPGEESIQVTVVTLSGREVASFLTSSGTRVSSMKKLIQEAGGPDTRLQALSCGGQILDNAQSCSSLGWTADEAVIVTMARVVADVDECLAALLRQDPHKDTKFPQGLLEQLFLLCAQCKDIFLAEPMLLELQPPFVIVGNMHGYYEQLLGLFKRCGDLPATRYLFLGNYVDRGRRCMETITLLFLRKVQHPENLILLRGNHEDGQMSRIYGFYDECKRRTNVKLWKSFLEAFNCMPVCALIQERIFCVNGGLSPELRDYDCIRNLKRPSSIPESGLLCDLLWSDPQSENGWAENDRGVSYCFGPDAVQQFVSQMGLDMIVRSHQVVQEGYELFADKKLVTLWSIFNFKGEIGNLAAVMRVSEKLEVSFETFIEPGL